MSSQVRLSRGVLVGAIGAFTFVATLGLGSGASGQAIAAPFSSSYSLLDLGTPGGVPGPLGGLTLEAGTTNTFLIGGNANGSSGAIYAINVTRGAGNHITGFSGSASLFATAPNIDGGLAYGPGGVLFYTGYPVNQLG